DQELKMPDTSNQNTLINGPDRYDSMLIDLTGTGWQFLQTTHEPQWDDAMVGQPAQPPTALTVVEKRLTDEMMKLGNSFFSGVCFAARKYLELPACALQLRLALFTDKFPGHMSDTYRTEFNDLVR